MSTASVTQEIPLRRRSWTVEEFQSAIRLGLFHEDERLELLQGEIIELIPVDPTHSLVTGLVNDALMAAFRGQNCHVRTENPIVLPHDGQPQPDVIVACGQRRAYPHQHPTPVDVFLLVEVSGSTLAEDRSVKSPLYAIAGITEYWIVNLKDRQLEVHRMPQNGIWTQTQVISATGTVAPLAAPQSPILVSELLP